MSSRDSSYLDDELDEGEDFAGIDEAILSLLGEDERELDCEGIDTDMLMASLRRLYLAGKIRKRKDGKKVFYRLASDTETRNGKEEPDGNSPDDSIDRRNVSRLARKFRSCRYKVERNYVASNGVRYTLALEKKDKRWLLLYAANPEAIPGSFEKMTENDPGIRIVVPDDRTKLEVAKLFNDYVSSRYEDGLLSFNENNSFRILTMEQFFKRTTWKNLLK